MSDENKNKKATLPDPNFRWLVLGAGISNLGDQFTMVALPWLVLVMTGDALTLGLVVALMGLPRAIFILFGGAFVDRYSPKRVLMLTKHANALLLGVLAALVLTGHATLPAVIAIALLVGLAQAFGIPSGTSLTPHVVAPAQLQQANATLMGVRQVSLLAGPLLAAVLFTLAGDGRGGHGLGGLGIAFAIDCASFVLSAWTLSRVRVRDGESAPRQPILRSIGEVVGVLWRDTTARTCFIYWGICACIVGGVVQVGLPVLANERLHGAAALGLLLGAHGIGVLGGMALTGVVGNLRLRNLGTTLLAADAAIGILLLPLPHITAWWQGVLVNLVVGVLAGFMQVAVFTWIQQRVPRSMLGRTMSIFMFIFMGLAPLAAALAGWALQASSLAGLFTGSGLFLAGAAAIAFVFTPMRAMADAPAPARGA